MISRKAILNLMGACWGLVVVVSVAGLHQLALGAENDPAVVPAQQLAVPAEFVRFVTAPGAADFIKRPTAVHWDRFHRELLVADSGHNRIVVFAPSGSYKFEFALGSEVTAPADIVTDPEGYIYVLGSKSAGRTLHRFDFDGLSLGPLALPAERDGVALNPRSVACGVDGRLYLLDSGSRRVLILDPGAGVVGDFSVTTADRSGQDLFGLGTIAIAGDELLIPVATEGTVMRFSLEGSFLGTIGRFGAKPGTLNFPVAVAVSDEGIIAVLDQGRFCVVCYSADGRVLGEFGGKGQSPGWFINPSLLAVTAVDRVVVGQIFQNRIQICALPDFVRGRNRAGAQDSEVPPGASEPTLKSSPRHTSRSFNSPSSELTSSQHNVPVSHLEVSE